MTTLIQQKSPNDCVLAAIAMAKGCTTHEELWALEDIQAVIASRGVSDEAPWMLRAGFVLGIDYKRVSMYGRSQDTAKGLLWNRRAILSVSSLNNDGGHHAIYWDGKDIYDPSPKRTFLHLSSVIIHSAWIFAY